MTDSKRIEMNHKEFITKLSENLGYTTEKAETMANTMVGCVIAAMEEGETLRIDDFGKFEVRKQYERVIANPKTGVRKLVPPRLSVAFTPAFVVSELSEKEK